MTFIPFNFSELNTQQLYDILQLRSEVFVVEQDCVYQDIDGCDQKATHILAYDEKVLVAYARILPPKTYFKELSIGRIIVKESHRGKAIGHKLMAFCLVFISKQFKPQTIKLSAQEHLKSFYEYHGFQQQGVGYLEDGIPHVAMYRHATPN
ncbi:GNAT family N-acetyltransferase [Flavobacteriaceae bacterium 14752]|uniref:GNAT family N-acetyltransferase n=1 Tax=Mesohalobacter salilacus TaxID=2491711 RepID=UPI000F63B349|nr:GNAT family N-acetyltransferase [Flavobacteriaceae bacterium 14752]